MEMVTKSVSLCMLMLLNLLAEMETKNKNEETKKTHYFYYFEGEQMDKERLKEVPYRQSLPDLVVLTQGHLQEEN